MPVRLDQLNSETGKMNYGNKKRKQREQKVRDTCNPFKCPKINVIVSEGKREEHWAEQYLTTIVSHFFKKIDERDQLTV